MNDQQTNRKCYQHEKVRQYYNEYETNKIKKNIIKKNEQLNLKQNEDKKWRNYHKKFNE